MSADSLILAPYGVDPLPLLAHRLLDRHADELPDLSRHVALFPQPHIASRFRAALLAAAQERGVNALLPPWTGTLPTWLATLGSAEPRPLTAAARELLLLEALASFPALAERFGAWPLIDGVLPLFDELTTNAASFPTDRAAIRDMLAEGYRVPRPLAPLEQEADWISTLWRAWSEHLDHRGWRDSPHAYQVALAGVLETLCPSAHVYLAADINMSLLERRWARALRERNQLTVLLQGAPNLGTSDYHPDRPLAALVTDIGLDAPPPATPDAYGELLQEVYRGDGAALYARATDVARRHPLSPAHDRLALYIATDLESEARAVELQVRRWLLAGMRDVAIVTSDRKLARRVRALLERANVALDDSAGWTLSTTSAATALARWLECCEREFAHAALLDFLKSPFVTLGMAGERYALAVRKLEHGLIRRYRVASGLARYRTVWRRYRSADDDGAVDQVLEQLARAAEPLARFLDESRTHPPAAYLAALNESLHRLGLLPQLQSDPAGRELLAALDALRAAPTGHSARFDYASFRHWLERELERRRFRSAAPNARVRLLSAVESSYCYFDAVVIPGCTSDQLPGAVAPSPFFNETVRRNLGLPAMGDRLSRGLHDFRRLLQAAPTVLLTYRRYENREPKLPSPWLERLVAFHHAAYGAIADNGLARLIRTPATGLTRREEPLPAPSAMPAAHVPPERLPSAWTASAHQRLLDCPYQFYSADVLKLLPLDAVPEELERSHYGERVHRILHAFHRGIPGLPGPWTGLLSDANRPDAERLLHDISRAVFAGEISDRFTTRAWLYHWQEVIPAYLDWLQANSASGRQVAASEIKMERSIYIDGSPLTLKGRIDRVDDSMTGKVVLDYKTGQLPDGDSILAGEQIQLPFYTLLLETGVDGAMYVCLREPPVKTERALFGDDVNKLRHQLLQRIETMVTALRRGTGLAAWGDPQTCGRCRYEGLCRRELWTIDHETTANDGTPETK